MKKREEFICPKCKEKNTIKIVSEVSGDDIAKIIDKSIFNFKCKRCNEQIMVEYPLKVLGENYLIYYTPGVNATIDENMMNINRVCDTYNDLKEKVLILEDGLNDIAVEIAKDLIKRNLDDLKINNIDELEHIRYNSKDNTYLNFSLVGTGEMVGFEVSIYQDILDNVKFKKINKSVLIDEYTYKSYIRRGYYETTNKKRLRYFKW